MRQFIIRSASICWNFLLRHSWAFTALGIALTAVGSVASNVTASAVLKPSCGESQICFDGFRNFFFNTYEGWMIVSGAFLSIFGAAVNYQDKIKIDELTSLNEGHLDSITALQTLYASKETELNASMVDVYRVFSLLLRQIYHEFGLGVSERISIYKVSDTKFFIAGRYSEDAGFNRVRRKYYERGHGVIEQAWKQGWAELEIRSLNSGNSNNRRKYAEEHNQKCGIPARIINDIQMKSRSYRALSIKDRHMGSPIAIVCIESVEKAGLARLSRDELEVRFGHMAILIEALEHHVATLDNAMSEGL